MISRVMLNKLFKIIQEFIIFSIIILGCVVLASTDQLFQSQNDFRYVAFNGKYWKFQIGNEKKADNYSTAFGVCL